MGFTVSDPRDVLKYRKYQYWAKGIPTHLFRKERASDVEEVLSISKAIQQKKDSTKKINDLMNSI